MTTPAQQQLDAAAKRLVDELPTWVGIQNGMYVDGFDYEWLVAIARAYLADRAAKASLTRMLYEQSVRCETVNGVTILIAIKRAIEGGPQLFDGFTELWQVADHVANLAAESQSQREAEDARPIDAELFETAFVYHPALVQYARGQPGKLRLVYWPDHTNTSESGWFVEISSSMSAIPEVKTVGQLRKLCEALGCPLPEEK